MGVVHCQVSRTVQSRAQSICRCRTVVSSKPHGKQLIEDRVVAVTLMNSGLQRIQFSQNSWSDNGDIKELDMWQCLSPLPADTGLYHRGDCPLSYKHHSKRGKWMKTKNNLRNSEILRLRVENRCIISCKKKSSRLRQKIIRLMKALGAGLKVSRLSNKITKVKV